MRKYSLECRKSDLIYLYAPAKPVKQQCECSCSNEHRVCLFSLQPRQIRELDKFSLIFVVFTQMLYLVSNVGVIVPQELLLHLSVMIALHAPWSSPAEYCFGIFALSFTLFAVSSTFLRSLCFTCFFLVKVVM